MMSTRAIPPKMLIRIARTFGSSVRMRKLLTTRPVSLTVPISRKFAGSPPASLMASIVAIASPAPFTTQPMFPVSFT